MALHAILSPASRAFLLAASLLAGGLGASSSALAQQSAQAEGQTSGPKSLLPDDIETAPLPPPATSSVERGDFGGALQTPSVTVPVTAPVELPPPPPPAEVKAVDPLAELAGPTGNPAFLGPLTLENGGYSRDLFAGSQGWYLSVLLNRIEAPLASRWAQIMVQRALLTRADAPAGVNPSDWVAARAQALVMMGAGADAHRLVSRVSGRSYTAPLYGAALLAALSAGDPMALCPLSPVARKITESPSWDLADAMCLAIMGDDIGATSLFDRLRRQEKLRTFDIGLAERVASTTGAGRRGANPEWGEISELTVWRVGLASAAGLEIPQDRLNAATLSQKALLVRMPGQAIAVRAQIAPAAAATGAISSAEINRILAAEAATLDASQVLQSPGGQLRTARTASNISDRIEAMQDLWKRGADGTAERYGWQIATATAASNIPVSSGLAEYAADLAASYVSAGAVTKADAWWKALSEASGEQRAKLWAHIVAVSDAVPVEGGFYTDWAVTVSAHRAQLLAAGLQGLGRGDVGVKVASVDNEWTKALSEAAAAKKAGDVMVLVATGLQGEWAQVPPDYLRRISAALVAIGREAEARLIVAEAANRG